jgi:transcriptional regulator with XRE-family HTH domain
LRTEFGSSTRGGACPSIESECQNPFESDGIWSSSIPPLSGDLASISRSLRDSLGLNAAEVSRRTIGMNAEKPELEVVSRQQMNQIENKSYNQFLTPAVIQALAQAYNVPHFLIYGANAVTVGLDPIPAISSALIPEEFTRLPIQDQMLVRQIILSLAAKNQNS